MLARSLVVVVFVGGGAVYWMSKHFCPLLLFFVVLCCRVSEQAVWHLLLLLLLLLSLFTPATRLHFHCSTVRIASDVSLPPSTLTPPTQQSGVGTSRFTVATSIPRIDASPHLSLCVLFWFGFILFMTCSRRCVASWWRPLDRW